MLAVVLVMQTSHLKKFLKMIFGRSSLSLDVTLGNHYALLVIVDGFLVTSATAGHRGDMMGSPLLPLLAALKSFSCAFDYGFGRNDPATVGRRPRIAKDERGPNLLFTGSVLSCDVE
jgi:hypothetical protein